jgi:hypothetical protein
VADNSSILDALKGVNPADAMPFGAGATPEGSPNALSSMLSGLLGMPKHLVESAQQAVPGLRKADVTDNPHAPEPNQPLYDASAETALNLLKTGMPAAEAGSAGMVGGRLSATADHRMADIAEKMASIGQSPEEIRKTTGWFFDSRDKIWKYEIPDPKMHVNMMPDKDHWLSGTAGSIFTAPETFKAYPHLRDMRVEVLKGPELSGLHRRSTNSIEMTAPDYKSARSLAAHEFQHPIQDFEGFSPGTSQGYWSDFLKKHHPEFQGGGAINESKLADLAYKRYRATAGEAEARNNQTRLNYTPLERLIRSPIAEQFHDEPTQFVLDSKNKDLVRALRYDPRTNSIHTVGGE